MRNIPPGMRRRGDVRLRSHIGWDIADHAKTSSLRHNWYVNETDQFETSVRRTNWHLSETDQLNTSQRRHNWYLNETDFFETL